MSTQKRILIVEDKGRLLRKYMYIVSSAGYVVSGFDNLKESIAAIDKITYHVAMVDIELKEEDAHEVHGYNRDGLKIIERLSDLREGTEVIILSGLGKVEVAVEAFQRFGISEYLEKSKVHEPSDIVAAIDRAYEKCHIKDYGSYDSPTSFLSGGNTLSWEHQCLSVLHPSEGMKGLAAFFSEFCKTLTPLLPRKNADAPMQVREDEKCVTGDFWSKGLGQAVSLVAYPKPHGKEILKQAQADAAQQQSLVRQYEKANVLGLVFSLSDLREDFVEHL